MTKADIISDVSKTTGFTKVEVEVLLDSIINSIKLSLANGERVDMRTRDDKTTYVIDDRFMVDDHGVSHYKSDVGHWKFLCTVAQGNLSKMSISTKIGDIELESTELTIMGKIGFLLAPDITDSVFFHQLSEKMQDVIKQEVQLDSIGLGGTWWVHLK